MSFGIPVRNGLMLGVSTYVALSARRVFSPASLFAAGEPGAWYDPSDFSTLFQDSAGTTPVTDVAQQVGLMLDKSQGLVLGPELVTNGDFSGGTTTGWTALQSTLSVTSGELIVTASSGGSYPKAFSAFACVVGRTYEVSATARVISSASMAGISIVNAGGSYVGPESSTASTTTTKIKFVFTATSTTHYVAVGAAGATPSGIGNTLGFDNISAKLLPGNHAFQSNSGQRPTLGRNPTTGRLNSFDRTEEFDNAYWVKTGSPTIAANTQIAPDGTLTADTVTGSGTNFSGLFRNLSSGFGTTYTSSIYAKAGTSPFLGILVDGGNRNAWLNLSTGAVTGFSGPVSSVNVGDGWFRVSLTYAATGVTHQSIWVHPAATAGSLTGTGSVFIWGAQSELGSTVTAYQRVVSSFDVTEAGKPDLYYVNFDGTDDGMLTNTITPGIDKAQAFAGVRKFSDAVANQTIVESSVSWPTNNGAFGVSTGAVGVPGYATGSKGNAAFAVGQVSELSSGFPAPNTAVMSATHDIAGDRNVLRVNGTAATPATADQGTGNFLAYPLYLGRRAGTSNPFNGNVYSMIVRFGANLTADQIAATETWVNGKTGAY